MPTQESSWFFFSDRKTTMYSMCTSISSINPYNKKSVRWACGRDQSCEKDHKLWMPKDIVQVPGISIVGTVICGRAGKDPEPIREIRVRDGLIEWPFIKLLNISHIVYLSIPTIENMCQTSFLPWVKINQNLCYSLTLPPQAPFQIKSSKPSFGTPIHPDSWLSSDALSTVPETYVGKEEKEEMSSCILG